ncbi:hypothetical protein FQZ97_766500 [compost metagenome]
MDVAVARERGGHGTLDDGARTDAAAVQLVDLHAGAARGRARAAHQDVALGNGVDLAVGALERRHQQGAAAQALGVAHGGHHHVQRLAGPGECRQRRGDHDGRHVLQLHIAAGGHGNAQLRQHVGQALLGERRLAHLVTAAVQAHDQTVADQLVAAHALDRGQVLEPLGLRRAGARQQAGGNADARQHPKKKDSMFHINCPRRPCKKRALHHRNATEPAPPVRRHAPL